MHQKGGKRQDHAGSIARMSDETQTFVPPWQLLALDAAAQQNALIETLFRSAQIGLAFIDRDTRFVRVNSILAEINGVSPEAHMGRTVREILPNLPNDQLEANCRRMLDT